MFLSCTDVESHKKEFKKGDFFLTKEHDSLYYLKISSGKHSDRWKLPYPVYQFHTGDIDNNGTDDALIGVIKSTRFDSTSDKRLFIFKNYKGLVRPLWLGSRLSQPLVNFGCYQDKDGTYIRSIEREKSGKYLVAEYKWRKFGLEFIRYLRREIDSTTALTFLEEESF
ncbi:hypothetical protein [Aquimarina sp. 2304DJ70-9]|uniref:hypothetical protein n=1 Tax=Aquimarina penaris TaxID=3231044 RepID=UPI00346192AD